MSRRRFTALIAALGLTLSIAPATSAAADRTAEPVDPLAALEARQQAVFAKVAPSVVFIVTKEGMGSGFVVSRDGLILTNRHVVGDHETVDLVFYNGTRVKGKVVEHAGKDIDLTLIDAPIKHRKPLQLASVEDLEVGAWAAAVGHGRGAVWTFNTGMISNIYKSGGERPLIQTQIPLNQGNSGGPVVDRDGNVVGVVTAGDLEAQALNFAIKIDVAVRELKILRDRCNCMTVAVPAGTPVFVDGRMRGIGPAVPFIAERGRDYEVTAVVRGKRRSKTVRFPHQRRVSLY
jgi:S1-C subfamily serine protease